MTPVRIVLTALFPFALGYFLSYLLRAVNAVVAPDLVADIGLSPAELGLLTSAYLIAFALFQLPLGVLLDRYGPRRVQAALLCLAALGCLGFAASPDFLGLFAARALIGLGFSAGLMASYKSSATFVPFERRSLANAAIMSMGALGVVVATEPTEILVSAIGWRQAFVVFAVMILAVSAIILIVAPRRDTAVQLSASMAAQAHAMFRILRTPLFWRLAPLASLTAGTQIGIQTLWAGPWLRDVAHYSRDEVARHLLYMAVAFMAGILAVGVIADRLGRRGVSPMTVMLGANIVYFAAQFCIALQWDGVALWAWLAVAAVGQVAILSFPWFAERVGRELAGRSNATINFSMFAVAFLTQYAFGLIIGLFPATVEGYDPRAYAWAVGLFLALQLLAFAWYFASPRIFPKAA